MSTLAVEIHPLAQNVEFTDDDLIVSLVDVRMGWEEELVKPEETLCVF